MSVRRAEDVLYGDELRTLTPADGLDVRWTYTRAPAPGPRHFSGRIDAAMLAAVDVGPDARPRAFVCGPNGFVETAAELLVAAGHAPERILTERFGPS